MWQRETRNDRKPDTNRAKRVPLVFSTCPALLGSSSAIGPHFIVSHPRVLPLDPKHTHTLLQTHTEHAQTVSPSLTLSLLLFSPFRPSHLVELLQVPGLDGGLQDGLHLLHFSLELAGSPGPDLGLGRRRNTHTHARIYTKRHALRKGQKERDRQKHTWLL